MKLHEYQSKQIFAQFGIPISDGHIATTAEQARDITTQIGGTVILKALVLADERRKAGGVKLARTPDEAERLARKILGMQIKGQTVHQLLVDPSEAVRQEIYVGITVDRAVCKPVIVAASAGSRDIEKVHRQSPESIVREYIDPLVGLHVYQLRNLAGGIHLAHEHWQAFIEIAANLFRCFEDCDATLVEANPLAVTRSNRLLALDAKIALDDSALFRHPELAALRNLDTEHADERQAREAGLSYVKLEGNIGCMVNGAGLAMTTIDLIQAISDEIGIPSAAANFLDIGGAARAPQIAAGLRTILLEPKVKAVLLNIFGGLLRCDEVARGLVQTLRESPTDIPLIVRFAGINADLGRQIIDQAAFPNVHHAHTLSDAATKVVMATQEVRN